MCIRDRYSAADPVADTQTIERVAGEWEARGLSVDRMCWPDTRHVSHFLKHPEQYKACLDAFLQTLRLDPGQNQDGQGQQGHRQGHAASDAEDNKQTHKVAAVN